MRAHASGHLPEPGAISANSGIHNRNVRRSSAPTQSPDDEDSRNSQQTAERPLLTRRNDANANPGSDRNGVRLCQIRHCATPSVKNATSLPRINAHRFRR